VVDFFVGTEKEWQKNYLALLNRFSYGFSGFLLLQA
jgi:hypothetical protein